MAKSILKDLIPKRKRFMASLEKKAFQKIKKIPTL